MSEEVTLIVDRCLAGHQPAFSQLIHRFRDQVFRLCYRMLGQREDAEDATQETFARVARSLHQWDSTRSFEPWLMTIAGNRCRTQLAKRRKHPSAIPIDFPIEETNPSRLQAESELLREEVNRVLDDLRNEYQQAFVLFHEHGLEYAEIANRMGVPLGTVKTWVHRARKDLISRLRIRGVLEDHATSE